MDKLKQVDEIPRKQMGFIKFPNRSYPVYEGLNIVGRDPKATVRVKDLTFSKQHAIISIVNDTTHLVSDFGSSNGTEVRSQKLVPYKFYEIRNQESVTFGDITGEYHKGADPNFNKENYFHAAQSQVIDANATTQLLIENIHDLPTQQIVIDIKDKRTQKDSTQNIHEAETQQICKTNDGIDSQLLSKPTAILEAQKENNNVNIINTCTENYADITRSELYDDIFANESFRMSLENAGSKYDLVVDETIPTDPKLNKSNDVSMNSDDIILSTQDNVLIEQQAQQIILKQNKSDNKKQSSEPQPNEPEKPAPKNKDDDDSATDIEDEDAFIKQIQEKSTQFNNSKEKSIQIDSDSDTDVEEDLLVKKITNPTLDDSTTDIDDNLIANCDMKPNNAQKSQEPQNKISDENDDALLLVPTQLLDNTTKNNTDEESDDDEVDLLAGVPVELLDEQSNENDGKPAEKDNNDDLLAPTQLLTPAPNNNDKNKDSDDDDDDLLAPTQLLTANKNQEDDDDTDDDLLAPTQLLQTKSNENSPELSDDDLAPTQLLTANKIQEDDDDTNDGLQAPNQCNEKAAETNDDDLLAPTQLLQNNKKNTEVMSDDDLAPTQLLTNKNHDKEVDDNDDMPTQLLQSKKQNDSIFSAPTQILEKKPSIFSPPKKPSILSTKSPRNKEKRNVNFSEDIIYDMPTQKLDVSIEKNKDQDIYEAPTQLIENKTNKTVENIHEAPTQLLEDQNKLDKSLNDSSIIIKNLDNSQGSENASLKLVLSETDDECSDSVKTNKSDTNNIQTTSKEIVPQPETQLEVDFALETQKLYIEEKTSRPDNPLGHMFAEEPTQMTEEIIEDKSEKEIKPEDIETSRRLQIKLHNVTDLTKASTSKISSTSDESDFKQETKKGRPKKQKKEGKIPENVPKLNIVKIKPSEDNQKKKQNEKANESLVKSSDTDEDKTHNTRGKRISYHQLNAGKIDNKKATRGRPKKSESEEQKKELEVKKSARKTTRQLQTPETEDKDDDSSDLDDFINRVTRSKRTHSVAETPKKKSEIEDSDSDTSIVTKKKIKKLEYTQETEPSSSNSSEVVRKKPTKRTMKIENYSSDEGTEANTTTSSFCLNTPNTKRRRYQALNVTMNSTPSSGEIKHKVVFTMLSDTSLETSVKKLGGSVIDSAQLSTVLVTNKISRSLKFLTAVALGKPIVQAKWVKDSIKKNLFQDPWDYLLEDKESESKFNFSLKDSLKKSSEKLLLTDIVFLIAGKKNCEVLKEIIEISGGKCISRAPGKNGTAIVVSYEEEKAKYSKYLKQKNLTVVSAEAIFSGVLRQEVNWNQHLLS